MKPFAMAIGVVLATAALAQTHTVAGHFSKSGKWIPQHEVKNTKRTHAEVQSDEISSGKHRVHRFYAGHYADDGHWIKPHWRWVWVKD